MPRYIPGAACWWPMIPKPPVIGAAASDAQAAVGIYWYIPAGQDTLAEPPPEGARLPSGGTTAGPWPVVSKCALREGRQRERNTQVIPDAPPSVPSCWSITAFPACVILPQMNRQPMCIWMVKPPFTQYISAHFFVDKIVVGLAKKAGFGLPANAQLVWGPKLGQEWTASSSIRNVSRISAVILFSGSLGFLLR